MLYAAESDLNVIDIEDWGWEDDESVQNEDALIVSTPIVTAVSCAALNLAKWYESLNRLGLPNWIAMFLSDPIMSEHFDSLNLELSALRIIHWFMALKEQCDEQKVDAQSAQALLACFINSPNVMYLLHQVIQERLYVEDRTFLTSFVCDCLSCFGIVYDEKMFNERTRGVTLKTAVRRSRRIKRRTKCGVTPCANIFSSAVKPPSCVKGPRTKTLSEQNVNHLRDNDMSFSSKVKSDSVTLPCPPCITYSDEKSTTTALNHFEESVSAQLTILYKSFLPFFVWTHISYSVKNAADQVASGCCFILSTFLDILCQATTRSISALRVSLAVDDSYACFLCSSLAENGQDAQEQVKFTTDFVKNRGSNDAIKRSAPYSVTSHATVQDPLGHTATTPCFLETAGALLEEQKSVNGDDFERLNPYYTAMRKTLLFSAPMSEQVGDAYHFTRDHPIQPVTNIGCSQGLLPWFTLQCLQCLRQTTLPLCVQSLRNPVCVAGLFALTGLYGLIQAIIDKHFSDAKSCFLTDYQSIQATYNKHAPVANYRFPVDEDLLLELGILIGHLLHNYPTCVDVDHLPDCIRNSTKKEALYHLVRLCQYRSELDILPRSTSFFMSLQTSFDILHSVNVG